MSNIVLAILLAHAWALRSEVEPLAVAVMRDRWTEASKAAEVMSSISMTEEERDPGGEGDKALVGECVSSNCFRRPNICMIPPLGFDVLADCSIG